MKVINILTNIFVIILITFFTPLTNATSYDQRQVTKIADDIFNKFFKHYPEKVTSYGLNFLPQNSFTDKSLISLARWQTQEDWWRSQLAQIDINKLKGTPEEITFDVINEYLQAQASERVCRSELWDLGPFGWQTNLSELAQKQPVGTPLSRKQAIDRWKQFPAYINQEISNLREGVNQGITAPAVLIPGVIKQLNTLLALPVTQSPFFVPGDRDTDENFQQQFSEIVLKRINPAIRKYRDFLANEYANVARKSIGIGALTNGNACYQAKVRWHVTLDIPAKKIHNIGLQQISNLGNKLNSISKGEFSNASAATVFADISSDPKHRFKSEEELLDYSLAALKRAQHVSYKYFNHIPKSSLEIKAYPKYLSESKAFGEYQTPTQDGLRPGIFYTSTYEPQERSKPGIEANVFHETIPGHHYQLALALESTYLHPVVNYISEEHNSGYIEGWALYAERLADEMGLYSSDVDRVGLLSAEALQSARLVVDTGIHVLGWSQTKVYDYLTEHTILPKKTVIAEIERYISLPGQATAYTLGKMRILGLRKQAKNKLGVKFDIKDFHNEILSDGAVTLGMLKTKITRWLNTKQLN